MDRSALLNACKIGFLRGFSSTLEIALSSEPVRILFISAQMQSATGLEDFYRNQPSVCTENALKQVALSEMEALLDRSFQTAYNMFRPSFSMAYDANALSLMDYTSVEQNLRIDEMTARLSYAAEGELRDLNARIAQLFDQKEIKERENPFRPYLFSRCIVNAVAKLGVPETLEQQFIDRIIDCFAESILAFYAPINHLLQVNGVDARVDLQIKQEYSPGMDKFAQQFLARSAMTQMSHGSTGGMQGHGTLDYSMFNTEASLAGGQKFEKYSGKGVSALTQSAVIGLLGHEYAKLRNDVTGYVRSPMSGVQSNSAGTQTSSEQTRADIVGILFDYILHDKLLPIEVRVQLGRLQAPLLTLFLSDSSLLFRPDHGVCMLLDRIGSVSCNVRHTNPLHEKILLEVNRIVDVLLREDNAGEAAFSRHLQAFEMFVSNELSSSSEAMTRAAQAVAKAEARSASFLRLSTKMARVLQHIEVDSNLQLFLVGSWARAIERVARDDLKQAEAMCRLVPDLVWSTYPKVTRESRQQLLSMIPVLVNGIREGLNSLGQADVLHEGVLSWMMGAHRKALRAHEFQIVEPTLAQIGSEFSTLSLEISVDGGDVEIKLDPLYLKEALLEQQVELLELDPLLASIGQNLSSRRLTPAGQTVAKRLQCGVWVELEFEGRRSLARINWVSPARELLILMIDGQALPALVSVGSLCSEFMASRALFVEPDQLCARAVRFLLEMVERQDFAKS